MEFESRFAAEQNPEIQGVDQEMDLGSTDPSIEQQIEFTPLETAGLNVEAPHACHWEIPTSAETVIGSCKHCGKEREFNNTPIEGGFNQPLIGKRKPKKDNAWLDREVLEREPNNFDYTPNEVFGKYIPIDDSY